MMEKLKTNVVILALGGGILAGMCGWKVIGIFEVWVSQAATDGSASISGLEAVFVALLTSIVAAYVGGMLVLAGQVAAGSPPPQYPATQVNEVVQRFLSIAQEFFASHYDRRHQDVEPENGDR